MISRLWRDYVSNHKATLFLAFFFMAVLAGTQASYVWLVTQIGDFAEGLDTAKNATEGTMEFAVKVAPLVIGITALAGASMYVQSILTNKVALSTIRDLQVDMFKKTQRADYALFSRQASGSLVSRFINDVTILTNALLRTLTNLGRDLLTIIAVIAVMVWKDPILSGLVLIIYPLILIPLISLSRTLRGNSFDAQAQVGIVTSQLTESFTGARMVKTYGLEDDQDQRLHKTFTERLRLYLKLVTNQARVDPMMEVIGGLAIVGVIIAGTWRVLSGASTGWDVAGVFGGLVILAPRFRALGTLNNVIQEGLAALSRMFDLIDEQPKITNSPDARALIISGGSVKLDAVTFTYADGTQALSGVTLEAKPGQTIALVGPSGGGKSTIINLIPRLYDASSGSVSIDGQDVRDVTLESLRDNLALVSQDVTLFDDTVASNIRFGKLSASQEEIEDAAKAAAAHDFILALPQGYDTRVGEGGNSLSGGQRQRIALARAMLRDAPILLLDEATSALDAESEAQVQTALDRLSEGRTTIVIAHRLSTVRKADKIFVLENGEIVESGKHTSLMKKDGLYAKLRRLQFSE